MIKDLWYKNAVIYCLSVVTFMGFWVQLGVSGFRMDAVPFVIAAKGANICQA